MSQSIFKNPYVLTPATLTGSSVGNGTLTIDKLTHFTINQQYTAVCTSTSPFTVFNIVGLLDGAVGVAVVGTQFHDEDLKLFLTIQQGPTLFAQGDTFNFEVAQGTDVTQQNIDAYDELPQKNFGPGPVGQNAGDHNIRLGLTPKAASKIIGDLTFNALLMGPSGNDISIEYVAGSFLAAATRTIQSIKYDANIPGVNGNNIQIAYEDWTPGVQASKTLQALDYSADAFGTSGNAISIAYTTGGTAGAEVVTVTGNAISIKIQSGVSTADQIRLAIGLHPTAPTLIDVSANGTGSETQIAMTATFLTGGVNAIGAAGSELITVAGNLITVKLQSGVSSAQNIYDKLIASVPALSLITPTITGTPASVQTAPVATLNLQNGTNNVGTPGNEVVSVSSKEIKVTFISGQSTAQQIKTKIDANASAAALVSVALNGTGTELQSSPVAQTVLSGGSDSGTYSFNKAELTDPSNFNEGNAGILVTDIVNQGDDYTFGETLKKGKVTLDDDVPANLSGPKVVNAQQTINSVIQNSKAILLTEDNSKVQWLKPNLNYSADILFIFPETGVINRILSSAAPIVIADGQHAYVTVNRFVNTTVSVTVAATVPTGENVFRLFSRKGDFLIWYDNTLQKDKKKMRIGEGGGGGTAYQEKIGVGNGSATNFPLTFIPSNEYSILVVSSYVREVVTDYNYNPLTNSVDFVSANKPAKAQSVYVMYLTEGETIDVPAPSGIEQVFVHTITAAEELAKQFNLPQTPAFASKVMVDILEGGGTQEFNVDYNISVNVFQWAGYGLDGFLAENDKIRFHYYS